MNIEIGTRLAEHNGWNNVVASRLPVIHELLDEFRSANAKIELGKDYRDRDIIRLIVKDHGRTVRTAFSPDEFENETHLRNRLRQFVGQIARLEGANDCPNCGTKYDNQPLPFRCAKCDFQTVQACPSCEAEVSISDYKIDGSTLWQCPRCDARVHASYTEPMFDSRGFFVQPLVQLSVTEDAAQTSS